MRLSAVLRCPAGRRSAELNVADVDGDHQQVGHRPVVGAANIGAAASRYASAFDLDNIVDQLRRGKGTRQIDSIVVPPQVELPVKVEILLAAVRNHAAGEEGAQYAPFLVALLPGIELNDL